MDVVVVLVLVVGWMGWGGVLCTEKRRGEGKRGCSRSDGGGPAGFSQEDGGQGERQRQQQGRQGRVVGERGRSPGVGAAAAAAGLVLALGLLAQQAGEAGRALAAQVVQARASVLATEHLVVAHAS